jgi:hypothetical protein
LIFVFEINPRDAIRHYEIGLRIGEWDSRESMTEGDVEIILQRAHEKYPDPRTASKRATTKLTNNRLV